MTDVNKQIDTLHLFFVEQLKKRTTVEKKFYTSLSFEPFLLLEALMGAPMQMRHNGPDGEEELRPPRWYWRVYSIALIVCLLSSSIAAIITEEVGRVNFEFTNESNVRLTLNLSSVMFYAALLCHAAVVGGGEPGLRALQQLDGELRLQGHLRLHRHMRLWHVAALAISFMVNSMLFIWMINLGIGNPYDWVFIVTITYSEMQLMYCAGLLKALAMRLRHLALLSAARHLPPLEQDRRRRKRGHEQWNRTDEFELRLVNELMFSKVIKMYNKIMETYNTINQRFGFKILVFFVFLAVNLMISLQLSLIFIQNKESSSSASATPLMYSLFWLRALSFIIVICLVHESFTKAAEYFQQHLLKVIQLNHPEWSAPARRLLRYSEMQTNRFSVCQLFNMDIHLPYAFVGAMVTYVIALIQFTMPK